MPTASGTLTRIVALCALAIVMLSAGEVAPAIRIIDADLVVEQDLVVAAGARLEIRAGVTLRFAKDAGILAEGPVVAAGSASRPIVFCAKDTALGWGNVVLGGAKVQGSAFRYCRFGGGRGRVAVLDDQLQITGLKPASTPQGERQAGIGGALLLNACSRVEVLRCDFEGNQAGWGGGAISCWGGAHPVIAFCRFAGNSAGEDGGAIHCVALSAASIYGNLFEDNRAQFGGAIHCLHQSHATIAANVIRRNRASRAAGAVSGYGGSQPTLCDNLITDNEADSDRAAIGGGAGAVFRLIGNHLSRNRGKAGLGSGLDQETVDLAARSEAALRASLQELGVPGASATQPAR